MTATEVDALRKELDRLASRVDRLDGHLWFLCNAVLFAALVSIAVLLAVRLY